MRGRKPDLKMIERTLKYKKKGLSNVEIARILGKDEHQIRRWLKYPRTVIPS